MVPHLKFRTLLLCVAALVAGCQSAPPDDIAARVAKGRLVRGAKYQHLVIESMRGEGTQLLVLIEGDGRPWVFGGTLVARDPTPHWPTMLPLLEQSPLPTLYVGRPCYFSARRDSACRSRLWTSARYSHAVVDSLAAVIQRTAERAGYREVILAGHSGGGTLALLVARQLPQAVAVITLAANLDVDAWSRHHHYTRLKHSLNPADLPPLPARVQEWHAAGDMDLNVPPALNERYWARLPADRVLHFADADHTCCWAREWPGILARVRGALNAGAP